MPLRSVFRRTLHHSPEESIDFLSRHLPVFLQARRIRNHRGVLRSQAVSLYVDLPFLSKSSRQLCSCDGFGDSDISDRFDKCHNFDKVDNFSNFGDLDASGSFNGLIQ